LTATLEIVYEVFEQKYKDTPYFIDFLLSLSLLSLQGFDWQNILWPMIQNLDKTVTKDDEDKWQDYYRQYKIWHWVEKDNRLHQITREFLKNKLETYPNKIQIQQAFTNNFVSIAKTFKDSRVISKDDITIYSLFAPHL